MKILSAKAGLDEALAILRSGGIIAHATETCYGLACDIANQEAVEKLFMVKQRPADQPVSALFSTIDEARQYVLFDERAEKLAVHLPGPLTMILLPRSDMPTPLLVTPSGGASIGVRVSSHPLAHALVAAFGLPLTTTSANVHGFANPYDVEEIRRQFEQQEARPDLILDSGILPKEEPSTILDLTEVKIRIIRRGSLKLA